MDKKIVINSFNRGARTESVTVDIINWLNSKGITTVPLNQVVDYLSSYLELIGVKIDSSKLSSLINKHIKIFKLCGFTSLDQDYMEAALAEVYKEFKPIKLQSFYNTWRTDV